MRTLKCRGKTHRSPLESTQLKNYYIVLNVYIFGSKFRLVLPEQRNVRDVEFTGALKEAMHYETREEAEVDALIIFERGNIQIDTPHGRHGSVDRRSS